MISPLEALALIRRHAPRAVIQKAPLSQVEGLILAKNLAAPFPMPLAENSAMDGYVIQVADVKRANLSHPAILRIVGTIKAGDSKPAAVKAGTAYRIMTGALIPRGGEAVIPREDVVVQGHDLQVQRPVQEGQHIRRQGEEIKKGAPLLKKGTQLNPAAVGVLASFGFADVPVYQKPRVTVIATGNELIAPGRKLSFGKIYDSNSWMIRAALTQMGLESPSILTLRDDLRVVRKAIRSALRGSEYLILLGGVSVGDYDVVKEALNLEAVKTIFWRVSQKPGKPLFVGRKGKRLVFGLPGNPAAAFTCFYEYVYPALTQSLGHIRPGLKQQMVLVDESISADPKRHLFLKARILKDSISQQGFAQVLPNQGSHMLTSLVEADGFLRVPAELNSQSRKKIFQMDLLPYKVHE